MFLVLEFVSGGDLSESIKAKRRPSEAELRVWLRGAPLRANQNQSSSCLVPRAGSGGRPSALAQSWPCPSPPPHSSHPSHRSYPLHSLRPLGSFRFRYAPLHSASGSLLGLEHLHVSGICHRDIKPENILWDTKAKVAQRAPTPTLGTNCCHDHPTLTSIHNDTTNDTQVAKLTDFGVSDFFDNEHIGGDFIQVGVREGERGWSRRAV